MSKRRNGSKTVKRDLAETSSDPLKDEYLKRCRGAARLGDIVTKEGSRSGGIKAMENYLSAFAYFKVFLPVCPERNTTAHMLSKLPERELAGLFEEQVSGTIRKQAVLQKLYRQGLLKPVLTR